jgi:Tfp pilus assembly protein PilF
MESQSLYRELGNQRGLAYSLNNLGDVAREQGDYAAARTWYAESLALVRELGNQRGIAYSLHNLGLVASDLGDFATARTFYAQSLLIRVELGNKRSLSNSLEDFATLACVQDQASRAARVWGAAEAFREEAGAPLSPMARVRYDRRVAQARAALSEDAFASAWSEGRALTLEQAIEYALQDTDAEQR